MSVYVLVVNCLILDPNFDQQVIKLFISRRRPLVVSKSLRGQDLEIRSPLHKLGITSCYSRLDGTNIFILFS